MEDQSPVESAAVSSLPSARDILADVAALSDPGSRESAADPGVTGTRIGWEGATRKLIRKRDPRFPDVLAAMGQEIEGEARITVAPSGSVTRVEMTRGTGYSEIDAVIEAALRDYLFSRVDGKGDAMGTVRFRFRLERRD
jgi:TonB family protein